MTAELGIAGEGGRVMGAGVLGTAGARQGGDGCGGELGVTWLTAAGAMT